MQPPTPDRPDPWFAQVVLASLAMAVLLCLLTLLLVVPPNDDLPLQLN